MIIVSWAYGLLSKIYGSIRNLPVTASTMAATVTDPVVAVAATLNTMALLSACSMMEKGIRITK